MNAIERFTFGRPVEAERVRPLVAPRPATALVGRVLVSAIFLFAGVGKFIDYGGSVAYADAAGLPLPGLTVLLGALLEIGGGLAILLGLYTRVAALALIVFLGVAAYYFHDFWNLTGMQRQAQQAAFMKNVAIGGAMLLLIAFGADRYSVDHRLKKRRASPAERPEAG